MDLDEIDDAFNTMCPTRTIQPLLFHNEKYTILKEHQSRGHLVIYVQYESSMLKEVLVFKDAKPTDLVEKGLTYFSENKKCCSPVAKFPPNPDGWAMAVKLCNVLEE